MTLSELPILITGGAGYIGAHLSDVLAGGGAPVRVLDSLVHGQDEIARRLEGHGTELIRADIRDDDARRSAVAGTKAVVHLAAIVGDPACARQPAVSHSVNVDGSQKLLADAAAAGVERFVFASTCSNYGRMADPTVPISEDGELAPVSLYAEQKVSVEQMLLAAGQSDVAVTCLRFATVYGVAPRMRFDLTVNEFTRDLWADRELQVFGEQFWRPYVHVRDAARAVDQVLRAEVDEIAGEVFNVGSSSENYRKLDLVEEIQRQIDTGTVTFVHRNEDPRDYKVSFEKIRSRLRFEPLMTVPQGVSEIVEALSSGQFSDPFAGRYRN